VDYLYNCVTEQKPSPGSMYYYAYRKLGEKHIRLLYALDQIKWQWVKASELYHEKQPALQKLQWWQQELQCLGDKVALPALKQLSKYVDHEVLYKYLSQDLEYAIETLVEGRSTNIKTHLRQNYLGVILLKAKILMIEDHRLVTKVNYSSEVLRHLVLLSKHYARQIILDDAVNPQLQPQQFKAVLISWLNEVNQMALDANLKNNRNLQPLYQLQKMQKMVVKKRIKKLQNPFTEQLIISPLALLFAVSFPSKC
jgi:hypothetical protein